MPKRTIKKAFTLIELLVVIAIIAILAAILFPVFAQAKVAANKAVCLSNLKQIGTATLLYSNDADDMYPLGYGFDTPSGKWLWSLPVALEGVTQPDLLCHFGHSLRPYGLNAKLVETPGAPLTTSLRSVTSKIGSGITYNGLLHSISQTYVASPSNLPMYWSGRGKANEMGVIRSNPILICDQTVNIGGECRYRPGAPAQTGAPQGGGTVAVLGPAWVFARSGLFIMADGSAKTRQLAAQIAPANTDRRIDPYQQYRADGIPIRFWSDGMYPWLFRPDYDFSQ